MPIEQASYPKPWTLNVFHSELEMMRRGERTYLVATQGKTLVGYAGELYAGDDAHVTNIAVGTPVAAAGHRHAVARRTRLGGDRARQ